MSWEMLDIRRERGRKVGNEGKVVGGGGRDGRRVGTRGTQSRGAKEGR